MDLSFTYNFPALRGYQACKEYYVVMCPLRLIPKIFLFDEEEIPVEYRAQRILNKSRIPDMTNYILENTTNYVFSSITASVDGELIFEPLNKDMPNQDLGLLRVSMDARFLINDGQHRRAAIEEALKIAPDLGNETISVVFFHDTGLNRSQQIFSDLNLHAINTTSSIGILYDYRDPLSIITKDLVSENHFLSRYTDKERVSLSKNSPKVLALNFIHNTNKRLLCKSKGSEISNEETTFLIQFWDIICESILEWQAVLNKELSPRDLRINYIVGHSVLVEALGEVGKQLKEEYPDSWQDNLKLLRHIDWSRSNTNDWLGRCFNDNGRIQKTNHNITATANRIRELIEQL
ncbi:DNA sulfur modification protein DndB [Solibacillus isronensis B3W22]|uniref:DNA sulfur modification protein DndB n=1 Tax=Solibacillus isronensis B3W22 TaxID=1224748 RepID=K1L524_9BACL|nr:DNA sulfur modification protein DndB [Solibacillus isronensis]AMO86773.1 DNA sulfur modification protein DndB [Solibacillus silvestris]EKB45678.1 DNA sulfur modification protein DndB [Solibacillus isronensis B3W22]